MAPAQDRLGLGRCLDTDPATESQAAGRTGQNWIEGHLDDLGEVLGQPGDPAQHVREGVHVCRARHRGIQ